MSPGRRTRLELVLRPGDVVDLVRGDTVTTLTVHAVDPGRRELAYDLDGWPAALARGRTEVVTAGGGRVTLRLRKAARAYARLEFGAHPDVRIVRTGAPQRGLAP